MNLILHEADEWGDDQSDAATALSVEIRRYLIDERFACSRRQHNQRRQT